MQLDVSNDFESQLRAQVEKIQEAIQEGSQEGLDGAAEMALEVKNAEIEKTYRRSVRRLKNGKPAYERTNNWRNSQQIQAPDANTREIVTTGPAANYERRLANLPTGPDGVNRSNPADENTFREVEKRAQQVVEDGLSQRTERL